jgi:excisionase family DNA binding protein
MVPHSPETLLSKLEAAKRLGLSARTVHDLIKRGDLPAVRFGSRVLIRPTDIDALIDGRIATATKD